MRPVPAAEARMTAGMRRMSPEPTPRGAGPPACLGAEDLACTAARVGLRPETRLASSFWRSDLFLPILSIKITLLSFAIFTKLRICQASRPLQPGHVPHGRVRDSGGQWVAAGDGRSATTRQGRLRRSTRAVGNTRGVPMKKLRRSVLAVASLGALGLVLLGAE